MAFGLSSGNEIPASIGSWVVTYTTVKKGEPKIKENIELTPCKGKKAWETADDDMNDVIDKFHCSNVFEREIKGNRRSPEFKYVNIALKACVKSRTQKCASKRELQKFFDSEDSKVNLWHTSTYTST